MAESTGDGDGSKLNQHREVEGVIYTQEVLKLNTEPPRR